MNGKKSIHKQWELIPNHTNPWAWNIVET